MKSSRSCRAASIAVVLLAAGALVWAAWGAFAPGTARAQLAYLHGGIEDCETCHVNAHTWWTPTNEHCYDCHPGFQVRDPQLLCWTCHAPGEDMSAARSDAACTQTCHLFGGETSRHAAHPGRSTACTSCHALSASPSAANGSVHHTVPAPRLTGLAPAHGLPGARVALSGSGFTGATLVTFGGVPAVFTVTGDAAITTVVPVAAVTGPVRVVTRGGGASSAEPFVVTRAGALTLRVARAVVAAGRPVRLSGTLLPPGLSDAGVTVVVQRRMAGVWKASKAATRVVSAAGAYAWSFRVARRGSYRAAASFAGSPEATAAATPWTAFRVR